MTVTTASGLSNNAAATRSTRTQARRSQVPPDDAAAAQVDDERSYTNPDQVAHTADPNRTPRCRFPRLGDVLIFYNRTRAIRLTYRRSTMLLPCDSLRLVRLEGVYRTREHTSPVSTVGIG